MKQIQPLQIWANGKNQEATCFYLQINFDNLVNSATFYYYLADSREIKIIDGNLNMSAEDYLVWDTASDVNEWAYNWAAKELKLVILK
jgi:hypothetical protein